MSTHGKHTIHSKSSTNRLKHLAEILKNMDEDQAKIILSGLNHDVFDSRALQYLSRQLFNPSRLFKELTNDELSYMLKPLKMETLAGVISNLDKKNRKRCAEILGKKRYMDTLNHEKVDSLATVTDTLLTSLVRGVGEGTIAYNGIALLLAPTPCRRAGKAPKKKESILFQTLNPIVSPGEGIKILIHAPEHPNINVRLSLQGSGRRFFDADTWFNTITLDDTGFYLGDIFPREVPGPITLWLELPGGEVCRTVYFSQASRACYSIDILNVDRISGNRRVISFRLENNNDNFRDERVRVLLFCSRCGAPISLGFTELRNNTGHFEYIEPSGLNAHPHDYYLHIVAGGHQAGLRFNAYSFHDESTSVSKQNDRMAGSDATIELPLESHERVLFHVSTSPYLDRTLRHLIGSASINLEGVHKSPGGRKASPLEISLLHGELTLLAECRGLRTVGNFVYDKHEGFVFHHSGIENISDLYFTFYRITRNGIYPIHRHISYLKRVPQLLPVCPKYLESGEEVEIDIAYYLPQNGRLSINERDHRSLTGTGVIPLRINSDSRTRLELDCEGYNTLLEEISTLSRREKQKHIRIEYVPSGTMIYKNMNDNIELFAGPDRLYQYFMRKLLTYPWGCAEQTAAKITGYCIELLKESTISEDNIYRRLVQSGIRHLRTFKNREGYFSIFGHDHGPESTAVVLGNLAPLMAHRNKLEPLFPGLIAIINGMKVKLKQAMRNPNLEPKTQYLSYLDTNNDVLFNATAVLKNTHHNLHLKNNRLKLYSQGFYSLPAYCCTVAAALLEDERDSIMVFSDKRRIRKKINRSGFLGLLEILHIIPPRLEMREEIRGTELKNAMEFLFSAISIAHMENSYPSTVEIISMLRLLSKLKERIDSYTYRINGKKFSVEEIEPIPEAVEIISPFTWIRRISLSAPGAAGRNIPTVKVSPRFLRRGQMVKIQFASNSMHHEIYHLLLPPVLRATTSSKHQIQDQSVIIYPCREGVLNVRAAYRGKGYLRLLVENMYHPAQIYSMNIGLVEVV